MTVVGLTLAIAAASELMLLSVVLTPPDPHTANRVAVFLGLAVGHVADQPDDWQIALVNRLRSELRSGSAPATTIDLSPSRQQQVEANIEQLKQVWFVDCVERYSVLPPSEREAFLDEQIETVLAWSDLEDSLATTGTGAEGSGEDESAVASFFEDIEHWVGSEQDAELKSRMWNGVHDGIFRWLSTHSLEAQSFHLRQELALLISEQFEDGMTIAPLPAEKAEEKAQLRANCELLMEAWLRHQSMVYAQLPPSERQAYVRAKVETVWQSGVVELLTDSDQGDVNPIQMLTLSQQWIQRAPEAEREQLRALLAAVQMQLAQQWMESRG